MISRFQFRNNSVLSPFAQFYKVACYSKNLRRVPKFGNNHEKILK